MLIPRPAQQKELGGMLWPATGFPLPVQSGAGGDIVLRLVPDPGLGREGYQLRIADRVSISAPAAAGLFGIALLAPIH